MLVGRELLRAASAVHERRPEALAVVGRQGAHLLPARPVEAADDVARGRHQTVGGGVDVVEGEPAGGRHGVHLLLLALPAPVEDEEAPKGDDEDDDAHERAADGHRQNLAVDVASGAHEVGPTLAVLLALRDVALAAIRAVARGAAQTHSALFALLLAQVLVLVAR